MLAVSKTKPASMVQEAWQAGQRAFGENYVQEGLQKIQDCQSLTDIEWHLIGPLQSNKCKPVAAHFDWVQSVDRHKIAQRLNDNRPQSLAPLNVCLQINISGESSKSGLNTAEVKSLAEAIHKSMPQLCLRGLMAIPSNTEDDIKLAEEFKQMQGLFSQLQQSYDTVDTLSMGMSGDMALAIANGSTMVRVGTAIFGARSPKQ
ncbi:YggS family pyridoxal phosphate enzyme [Planctobacterium marinum]|uniref:Pyridoxal phosphate homeostasis protein n=1 Tax=Planctobacterium marinum TaxID=1631968 RepID=A0AA48HG59_9ALTE|nr:YggS family pyridoxal phosphate enzyme [Planctobacterium marinum]